MNQDRENLNDRYLDAALRDELGPKVDLTQRVLNATGAADSRRHRVLPMPRRAPVWQPLAAAAAVLIVAGLGVYALVQVLPPGNQRHSVTATQPINAPQPAPRPVVPARNDVSAPAGNEGVVPPEPKSNESQYEPLPPLPEPEPKPPEQVKRPDTPVPEPKLPEGEVKKEPEPAYPDGWTDPPEAWPGKPFPEGTGPKERAVLCSEVKPSRKDGVRLARDGKWIVLAAGQSLHDGDRVKVSGWADFTLADGTLVRLDGEMALTLENKVSVAQLFDGVLYADCKAALSVTHEDLKVTIDGQAVIEQRVRSLDVAVLSGTATSGQGKVEAGRTARLEVEGFGRDKQISFADMQLEHRFLKEAPERKALREDFSDYKGEIWSGEVRDGVLKGGYDTKRGLAFHFENLPLRGNEVVRLRYRVNRRIDLVLQFGTTGDGNFRYVIRGAEAGKWLEVEVPVVAFFTNMDESQKLAPGTAVRRFQLHDDDGNVIEAEVDWVEVISRP